MSPDAFAQMAIQLAYRRMFGTQRATYEPAQMMTFHHGRTEVVRGVTPESIKWTTEMCKIDNSGQNRYTLSSKEKYQLLVKAANKHSRLSKTSASGYGVDRHFLGLFKVLEKKEKIPSLFKNYVFNQSKYWYISTSNLSSKYLEGWGWGEVVPEGIGVAYIIKKDSLYYNCTSRSNFSPTFINHLENALRDMTYICEAAKDSETKIIKAKL